MSKLLLIAAFAGAEGNVRTFFRHDPESILAQIDSGDEG